MAWMASTRFSGASASVSRVPGPPPRTSQAATAGWSGKMTVTPVRTPASSAWPTFRPGTSVIRLLGPGQAWSLMAQTCLYPPGLSIGGFQPGRGKLCWDQKDISAMRTAAALVFSLLVGIGAASAQTAAPVDQAATEPHAMVAAANPLAVAAGVKVLRQGGSAIDAAVAVQAVLGLVEPQSSGLGGGAFMVYYDAATKKVTAYDGREVAPMGATPDMFLGPDGKPLPFGQAILSGRSAGVPGAVAMLYLAHQEHGRLAWNGLFDQAE